MCGPSNNTARATIAALVLAGIPAAEMEAWAENGRAFLTASGKSPEEIDATLRETVEAAERYVEAGETPYDAMTLATQDAVRAVMGVPSPSDLLAAMFDSDDESDDFDIDDDFIDSDSLDESLSDYFDSQYDR